MKLDPREQDIDDTIRRYTRRYHDYGYSPKTLGWDKGKQDIRFEILTSQYDFTNKSVLDIGCGFGDLNKILNQKYGHNYQYLGIDLVPDLIHEAERHYSGPNIEFRLGDFIKMEFEQSFDFIVSSGVFNHRSGHNVDGYVLIDSFIEKAMAIARDGLAFDFLSDKVDYCLEHTFHSSPEKILHMAYQHSKNIILRNDYMPFEFSIFIFKDDSFSECNTVFNRNAG